MIKSAGVRRTMVYLTGFMGSGKSTIGPILANTIGYGFLDTDREIERRQKRSVNAIFLESGELHFRDIEHKLLLEMVPKGHLVISLGGGTLTHAGNFDLLHGTGIIVYLAARREELFLRLRNKIDRPTLRSPRGEKLSPEELMNRIEHLYAERAPWYEKADITVPTDESRVGLTVDAIVRQLTPLLE